LTGDFTVEGYVQVEIGGASKFMFSYETTTANCLLVRAAVGIYGEWVSISDSYSHFASMFRFCDCLARTEFV
jgi:hypothetical protein